jgi:hypothetical protein
MAPRHDDPESVPDTRVIMAAMREVMTPQRMRILIGMLLHNAIEKRDTRAAGLLLDRVLGKVRTEPLTNVALNLPEGLKTTGYVTMAANALLRAVASGQIAPEDAQRTAAIIEMARKAIETQDLEKRIAELEERAKRERRR